MRYPWSKEPVAHVPIERFAGAHPSQQSWAPSAYKAADGHAFRMHMGPELLKTILATIFAYHLE